jgi:hypothetical protein
MGVFTIAEAIIGFLATLLVDAFAVTPLYNTIVPYMANSGLVISNLDYQVINVIMYVILAIPIGALLFTAIYAINQIIYKAGNGY